MIDEAMAEQATVPQQAPVAGYKDVTPWLAEPRDDLSRERAGGRPGATIFRPGLRERLRDVTMQLDAALADGKAAHDSLDVTTLALTAMTADRRTVAASRDQAETALNQSRKMDVVGQLAGGLAHDFNNLLMVIIGNLELLRRRAAQGRTVDVDRYATAALDSAHRAATLTRRLLAFSRRETVDQQAIDLNCLVPGMEVLVRCAAGSTIRIETRLAPGLWQTLCDANQFECALLNLVANARDAMPNGGRIIMATENVTLTRGQTKAGSGATSGDYVSLSVTDTGVGMPPEVIAHAFDAFFTTKPAGRGTGLGLPMIGGFVEQSGGHIQLLSEPGQGTTVTMFLPRYCGPADTAFLLPDRAGPAEVEAGRS